MRPVAVTGLCCVHHKMQRGHEDFCLSTLKGFISEDDHVLLPLSNQYIKVIRNLEWRS